MAKTYNTIINEESFMKHITPLRLVIALVAIFILGRTIELFDNPVEPQFGAFQMLLALVAAILFGLYIYLVVKERRK
jgi:hypothetical protein